MAHPTIDRLFADVGTPVRRVVLARGVEAWRDADGDDGWYQGAHGSAALATAVESSERAERSDSGDGGLALIGLVPRRTPDVAAPASPPRRRAAVRRAPGDDPLVVGLRHGLAPLLLASGGGHGDGTTHLVSSAGTLGWRPPIERLYDDPVVGRRARRLRFQLDALEHHAARAAESYAAAANAARTTAALFGGHELTTLSGQTGLFVELDALLGAVQRTYVSGARLLATAFPARRRREHDPSAATPPAHGTFDAIVLAARSAPPELRETLLAAWECHGAHAAVYRRALRARDARDLGHAPVQLARLSPDVWAVSVPVATPPGDGLALAARRAPRRRVDALDRAWSIATDAMRVVSLVVYAIADPGHFR